MKNLFAGFTFFILLLLLGCKARNSTKAVNNVSSSATELNTVSKTTPATTDKTGAQAIATPEQQATPDVPDTDLAASHETPPSKKIAFPETKVTMNKESGGISKPAAPATPAPITINPNMKPPTATVGKPKTPETPTTIPMTKPAVKNPPPQPEAVEEKIKLPPPPKVVSEGRPSKEPIPEPVAQLSHESWDQLLKNHVSSTGVVDYARFKANEKQLKAYLELLNQFPVQDNWPKAKKMAYWINAYNAATVLLIVDNYPLNSIMDLHGGKTWDRKWISLGGKTYSLNNIEHDILRPQFKDARIHFAVNCAAKSCPPLLNRAWTAANLEANFEKQAKAFINNSQFNMLDKKRARISRIFEWYAVDFGDNIIDYLNKYANTQVGKNAKVEYMEYDWKLNGK